ncbi:PREDICTED: uncharacterized protein LOC107193379 [Dufourea novaeangliae]|uniref:uncharacterized protein LOC107193379 n=1 Tax=Dufourea novaeangliae TaxID=178035 RepID=UPI0007676C41|nr:PREDICTED: uncharacterized protein LOC107193379 [Dufourea novaeangliae]
MTEERRKVKGCYCVRQKFQKPQQKNKEQCKRKRQTLVYNPEEEMYHEPYMRDLRKEFSCVSLLCDSKIELPWRDIALPSAGMKIRQEDSLTPLNTHQELVEEDTGKEPIEDESLGTMALPWKDLIVTEIVQSTLANPESCDSTLEIPWNDLVLEKPIEIQAPPEEACVNNDVEIPWNDILIPRNIVIEPQIKKKHPSSKYPPRGETSMGSTKCKITCPKVGTCSRSDDYRK